MQCVGNATPVIMNRVEGELNTCIYYNSNVSPAWVNIDVRLSPFTVITQAAVTEKHPNTTF